VCIEGTREGQLLLFSFVLLSLSYLRTLTSVPVLGITSFGYLSQHLVANPDMPPRRVSQRLHPDETPPQESIIPPPNNQPPTQILPTIAKGAKHLAFGNIPEAHLYQPINTSTTTTESSHGISSQATAGAPRLSLLRAPSPIHTFPRDVEFDHAQINDWDEEAKEEATTVEE
jgi:hypothetical protein